MKCEEFERALVGDDPTELAAAGRHAAECAACAKLLEADRELARRVAEWKAAAPRPADALRKRVGAAIRDDAPSVLPFSSGLRPRPARVWLAAAAAVVLLAAGAWVARDLIPIGETSDFERALAEAEDLRLDYARAIAGLERSARPVLARAGDPDVPPEEAALLLSYRDRLSHLDGVIAEVRGFLESHPGHAGGNKVLLAAYTEKQEVLSQLLALRPGETS